MADIIRAAKVHALQVAYKEYGDVQKLFYEVTGFNDDGVFYYIKNDEIEVKMGKALDNLMRAMDDLREYDRLEKTDEMLRKYFAKYTFSLMTK